MQTISQEIKTVGDVLAAGTAFGAVLGWLPPIAAALSIVWLLMQIWSWVVNKKWRKHK